MDYFDHIRAPVESWEPYKYVKNRRSQGAAHLYSRQQHHHSRSNYGSAHKKEVSRVKESKPIEKCSRYITISKPKRNKVVVRWYHRHHHEIAAFVLILHPQNIDRIKTLSEKGLTPFQICTDLNSEGREVLSNKLCYRLNLLQQKST